MEKKDETVDFSDSMVTPKEYWKIIVLIVKNKIVKLASTHYIHFSKSLMIMISVNLKMTRLKKH